MESPRCYLCGKNGNGDHLDVHHVFNGAMKKKSEKYHALVYLCHNECHIFGKNSVHQNGMQAKRLKARFQQIIMEEQGWDDEQFRKEFQETFYLDE